MRTEKEISPMISENQLTIRYTILLSRGRGVGGAGSDSTFVAGWSLDV